MMRPSLQEVHTHYRILSIYRAYINSIRMTPVLTIPYLYQQYNINSTLYNTRHCLYRLVVTAISSFRVNRLKKGMNLFRKLTSSFIQ